MDGVATDLPPLRVTTRDSVFPAEGRDSPSWEYPAGDHEGGTGLPWDGTGLNRYAGSQEVGVLPL